MADCSARAKLLLERFLTAGAAYLASGYEDEFDYFTETRTALLDYIADLETKVTRAEKQGAAYMVEPRRLMDYIADLEARVALSEKQGVDWMVKLLRRVEEKIDG